MTNVNGEFSRVAVVIPVHNEEEMLPSCLDALGGAAASVAIPVAVTVVLDSCTDRSEQVVCTADASPFERLDPVICCARSVGVARHTGSRAVIAAHGPDHLWLATTDADSLVPPDWLRRQLAHAANGARAVVGTVRVTDWSAHPPAVPARYHARYHSRPGHRHTHGANLSMAAAAYLAAGGFPSVDADEDVALVRSLIANGEPVVWAADLPVVTSARARGRTSAGFAQYLRGLADAVEVR